MAKNGSSKDKKGYSAPSKERGHFKENFKVEWIKEQLDRPAIDFAQKLGRQLKEDKLTTTQIRNFFGEVKRILSRGFGQEKAAFLLLLPKLHYAAKRADSTGAYLFRDVFDKAHRAIEPDTDEGAEQYERFVQFLEATLAYHRAAGGK